MKIYAGNEVIVEFGSYEVARSRRMEGWPIWAAWPEGEGRFKVRRVGYTQKIGFKINVTGATYLVVPYMTNSGHYSYTFVTLPDGRVTKVHASYPLDEAARSDPFIRAFVHCVSPETWHKADELIVADPSGSATIREVML